MIAANGNIGRFVGLPACGGASSRAVALLAVALRLAQYRATAAIRILKRMSERSLLPERLQPLLPSQLAFERIHLVCPAAAEEGDDDALHRGRTARLEAMRVLITARAEAGADSAPDRELLKNAALAVLANEVALCRMVGQVAPERWSRSVGRGDLCLWHRAGDLLPEAAADAAITHCLALMANPKDLERRTGGTFKVRFYALRALSGLGAAASACGRAALTDAVLEWATSSPRLHDELADMIDFFGCRLEPNAASTRAWQDTALALQHTRLAHAMLGALTEPTAPVVDRLRAGAARGEARALSALNSFDLLDVDTAHAAIEHHTQVVESLIAQAQQGTHTSRPDAPLDTLVHLGLRFPEHAAWPTVFRALASTHLLTRQSVVALDTLADAVNQLAPETRDELCALVRRMNDSLALDADGERVADRYDCLAVALELLLPMPWRTASLAV
ncbi:hypothetical protein ACIRL2_49920 [Embleya sp. NPDC127516]|uniref:hypothetical protein n=1 Tax=Embleya sp. NPDC127516 TaxID=3363990 RepID=UPI003821B93E